MNDLDPLTLIECERFTTSRIPQPFELVVSSNSIFMMDLHRFGSRVSDDTMQM